MWFWIVVLAIIYAELVGYIVHALLHSEKVGWLYDLHMEHHMEHYPADGPLLTEKYQYVKREGWQGKVSLEWVGPIAAITVPFGFLLLLFGVAWQSLLAAFIIALLYSWVMFDYMHRILHVKDVWIEKRPVLGRWFKGVRKLHFLHHVHMQKNLGIAFFWFDKLFETFIRKSER